MADRVGIRGRIIEVYARFSDPLGNSVNADASPSVEVTDADGVVRRILNRTGVYQEPDSVGLYRFTYEIPLNSVDGYWTDRWVAQIGGETVEASFQFYVQEGGSAVQDIDYVPTPGDDFVFTFTEAEVYGINKLLKLLKKRIKNDGVRKIPDGAGGYVEAPCIIFSTEELTCFLINSLSEFNQWPHFTNFTFADVQIQDIFADIIIQGGVLLALAAQTLIERGREFSITDNGVTYQPPAVSEILNSQYGTQLGYYKEKLKAIKTSLKPSPKGLGTFRVTAVSPNFLRLRHLRERQII